MAQQLKQQGKPYQVITMGAQYEGLVVLYNTPGRQRRRPDPQRGRHRGGLRRRRGARRWSCCSSSPPPGVTNPSFTNAQRGRRPARSSRAAAARSSSTSRSSTPAMQEARAGPGGQRAGGRATRRSTRTRRARSPIGGYNLAVSRVLASTRTRPSRRRCACATPEHQKFSAINDGVPPTIESVYDDPEMDEAYPMKDEILDELQERGDPAAHAGLPERLHGDVGDAVAAGRHRAAADRRRAARARSRTRSSPRGCCREPTSRRPTGRRGRRSPPTRGARPRRSSARASRPSAGSAGCCARRPRW